MTQEIAQATIKSIFGENAIAIGMSGNTVFWIYNWETESNYKSYELEEYLWK